MKIQNSFIAFLCFYSLFVHAAEVPSVAQLSITGVDKVMEENIRSSLNTNYEQALLQQEIQSALQPYGYYTSEINITPTEINIQLGEPIRVTHIHFSLIGEGSQDLSSRSLLTCFTLKIGDIFDHTKYEKGKKELLTPVIEAGYLNALFTEHRVEVDVQEKTAIIFLTLETGTQYYFGPVTYENTVLSPTFLARYLPFQTGEKYCAEKILSLQNKLSTSDYFSEINVKPKIDENNNEVPILIELKDAKPNQYLLGIGFGTDTGLRGRAGWLRRRVNSLGHQFLAEARLSEIYTKLEADYIIPGKHPETDFFKIRGGYFEDQFNDQPSRIHEATLTEDRQMSQWQRRLSLGFVNEVFPAFVTYKSVTARYILPSITFTQIKRDDPAAPTHGRRIDFYLRGSADLLFSNTSFIQADLQTKWLHSFSDTLRLLARIELGATLPDNVEKVPLSQRFYTGGDLTLRGYAYRSLPLLIDQNGNYHPAGGSYIAVGSLEIVKTVKKPFGVSAFIDAGNAFRRTGNLIAASPGIGVEWKTRFGPLKVALAKPLAPTSEASYRFHIIFGPEI